MNELILEIIEHQNTTKHDVWHLGPGLGEAHTWSGGKQLNGITIMYPINVNTHWLGDTCVY